MSKNISNDYNSPDYYVGKKLKWADGRGCIADTVVSYRPVHNEESTDFIFVQKAKCDPERAIRVSNDSIGRMVTGGYPYDPFPEAYFMIGGKASELGFASLLF